MQVSAVAVTGAPRRCSDRCGGDRGRTGFIAADPPHQAYSEAVSVTWDPDLIGFDDLIYVHLATHASMSQHKMRGKYRSAVYVKDDASAEQARRIIAELARRPAVP